MGQKKLLIHIHHIGSHFTNGLMPVAALLLALHFVSGERNFEAAAFYCVILSMVAAPVVFFSGYLDWRTRFERRSTYIFNHKRLFGVFFMLLSVMLVIWRIMRPEVAMPASGLRYVYMALLYIDTGFAMYLGYLGGKFI